MRIIQASSTCRSPSLIHPQLRGHISTGISLNYRFSPDSSIWFLKPKFSQRAVAAVTTRAILENSTSDSVATKVVERDLSLAIKNKASEISSDLKGTSIFLVGINSSYKLGLGQILADALRYYYFNSDGLVEEAAGGKLNAISIIENDEEGYLASEVTLTEVLKQLSSMGRLVVCAGNGAVKSATNLALLRHGVSIWIDVPLDLVAKELEEDKIQLSASDTPICKSSSEDQVAALYTSGLNGYSTADATISLQNVASQLGYGYDELDAVTVEDMCMEVLKEIEKLMRVKKMMEEAARPF
ncbi:probable inactive shikimate kinase like 1, chloroplastic isoform X2 [Salvia splendens]|uniref:probable inactive shikimate kinase like 1, chloroplastic isoform X2 n=1 Tax=Salvia splendens TaxID=180675 RepID=UPI001C257EC9|nr:probable inactive shikimate kinase like 1, chloroplastic isoform X2 [Salvia splendens]